MYGVSAQGVDERMINVHYYYHYMRVKLIVTDEQLIQVATDFDLAPTCSRSGTKCFEKASSFTLSLPLGRDRRSRRRVSHRNARKTALDVLLQF